MLFQWMAHSVLCEFLTKKHITTILLRCFKYFFLLQLLDLSFVYVNLILFLFFCLVLFFLATLAIVIFFAQSKDLSWENRFDSIDGWFDKSIDGQHTIFTTIITIPIKKIHQNHLSATIKYSFSIVPHDWCAAIAKKTPSNREKCSDTVWWIGKSQK